MKVSFISLDKDNEKVEFETEGTYDNNTLCFKDLSMPDTMMYVQATNEGIAIVRDGLVMMDSFYSLGKTTDGTYEGNGLKFNFKIFTQKLDVKKNKIYLEYVMSVESDIVGHNKITITLR